MAVEKMKLMNIVIEKDHAHDVLKDIAMAENIHLINAITEINDSNFRMKADEDHIDEAAGLCAIDTFSEKKDYKTIQEKLFKLMDYMQIERELDKSKISKSFDFDDLDDEINQIYEELSEIRQRIKVLEDEKSTLDELQILDGVYEKEVDFKRLFDLNYFNVKFGALTKENMERLTKNYDNIYAAVLHIGKKGHNEIYLVISLKELALETERILRSVYFEDIPLLEEYLDFPDKMLKKIEDRLMFVNQEIEGLNLRAEEYDQKYGESIKMCYAHLMMEIKIEQMKKLLAVTTNYVYISGWVAQSESETIEKHFSTYGNKMVFGFNDESDVSVNPPTKLKNKWLFRPFETLVEMYGTPSYTELDPTAFVGLAYMFLFGAMFGDVGQGLFLGFIGYLILRKSPDSPYGGILVRIGIFSTIFGFFYDSFFGYEHFISGFIHNESLFLRPIENINTMLILAVISGLVFILISYGYSIFNKLKKKDLQEGVFGRNGIVGVILFISILLLVASSVLTVNLPDTLLKVIIGLCVLLMIIREPLSNMILSHKPLYHESPSEYYVESGFELLETFLGMLSNSVSFIRVGAFALNHVGLFMAFHTIAHMIDSTMGNVVMFIVGNAIVLALEGMIVLIQGLRLIYYEMFSKYYSGDGQRFEPAKVENYGGNR